jgi:hypothetical protein
MVGRAVSSWLAPFCREFGTGPVWRFRSFAVTGWSSQLLCGPLRGFACFTWHHDEVAHIPERVTPSRAAPWRIHTVGDSMSGFGAVVVVACAVRAPDAPLGSVRLANLFRQQDWVSHILCDPFSPFWLSVTRVTGESLIALCACVRARTPRYAYRGINVSRVTRVTDPPGSAA